MTRTLIDPDLASERLTDEHDLAARLEAEALASALNDHRARAAKAPAHQPGVCVNCGEACGPLAVYCDADCRDDHEARVSAEARLGRGSARG